LLAVSNRRRWSVVILLLVASMINYFDRSTLAFALPLVTASLGLSPVAKGVLLSAFSWSYALMQVPAGLLADRTNLRWVYAGAFTLWSIAQALTGLARSLFSLICFRVLLGVGESIYLPGGTKAVSLLFPLSERGFPCGLFDFGTRTGVMLEGFLLPWLINRYGWRTSFVVVGCSALIWLVPWLWIAPREMRTPRQTGNAATRVDALPLTPGQYRNLFGICLGFFCFDYYWFLLVNWLPDYLVTVRKLTLVKAGIYASLPFLVFGICQPLGGWIGDRLVRAGWNETWVRKGLVSIAFSTGLLLIPAARAANPGVAIMFMMFGCLVGLSTANQLVILQACAPAQSTGLWTGIYNFAGNVAGILAPLCTGFLIQWTHSYTPAFVLAAIMVAAGQFSYWFLVGDIRQQT
jgi:MFS family permease